jgi:hypothetical protein
MTVTATKIDSSHESDKNFITWTTIIYNNFDSYAELYLLRTVVLLVAYSPHFENNILTKILHLQWKSPFYHIFWDNYCLQLQ